MEGFHDQSEFMYKESILLHNNLLVLYQDCNFFRPFFFLPLLPDLEEKDFLFGE